MMSQILLDPPKSPLKKGDFEDILSFFYGGGRGDQEVPKVTAKHF